MRSKDAETDLSAGLADDDSLSIICILCSSESLGGRKATQETARQRTARIMEQRFSI